MKNIIAFLVMISFFCGFSQNKADITKIPRELLDKGVLVDVRTPEEFKEGHLPGAVNIDWFGEDFLKKMQAYKPEETLLLYCRSGNRSGQAVAKLDSLGYKQVYNLEGGFTAWKETQQ